MTACLVVSANNPDMQSHELMLIEGHVSVRPPLN
jgi:hypothetical protein